MFKKLLLLLTLLILAGCGSTHIVTHTVTTTSSSEKPGAVLLKSGGGIAPPNWQINGGVPHAPGFGIPPPGDLGLNSHPLAGGTYTLAGEDAVTLSYISSTIPVVGCYNSGPYTGCYTGQNAAARFPRAHLVPIAVQSYYHNYVGHSDRCLDVERGDAYPSQAPGWAHAQIYTYGVSTPCIYASLSQTGYEYWRVSSAMSSAGIPHCGGIIVRHCYLRWLADWDGNPTIPAGYDAKQWLSGCCVDRDSFSSAFFVSIPPPKPNLPGCSTSSLSTSHCYGRFATVKVYNRTKGGWCYFGCVEQHLVKEYDSLRAKANKTAKQKKIMSNDEQRLRFMHLRLIYLIHHRSIKVNGDSYTYGREHEDYNRAVRHVNCTSWKRCDF